MPTASITWISSNQGKLKRMNNNFQYRVRFKRIQFLPNSLQIPLAELDADLWEKVIEDFVVTQVTDTLEGLGITNYMKLNNRSIK